MPPQFIVVLLFYLLTVLPAALTAEAIFWTGIATPVHADGDDVESEFCRNKPLLVPSLHSVYQNEVGNHWDPRIFGLIHFDFAPQHE